MANVVKETNELVGSTSALPAAAPDADNPLNGLVAAISHPILASAPSQQTAPLRLVGAATIEIPGKILFPKLREQAIIPLSLTMKFKRQALPTTVLNRRHPKFGAYIYPNEKYAIQQGLSSWINHGLTTKGPGLIVSCGTVRSFINLAVSNQKSCTGLAVVDPNPQVKLFVDGEALLFCLSHRSSVKEGMKAYKTLSNEPKTEMEKKIRIEEIKELTLGDTKIDPEIKKYYLQSLDDIMDVYYKVQEWKTQDGFQDERYFDNPEQFYKIQQYALAGRIVAIEGSINELEFLEDEPVAVVDVSNVPDYIPIALKGASGFQPEIIWTEVCERVVYHSYPHPNLSPQELNEYFLFYNALGQAMIGLEDQNSLSRNMGTMLREESLGSEKFYCRHPHSACKEVLNVLRKNYFENLYITSKGPINLTEMYTPSIEILDSLDEEDIAKMCANSYIEKSLPTVFQIIYSQAISQQTATALKKHIPKFKERFDLWIKEKRKRSRPCTIL